MANTTTDRLLERVSTKQEATNTSLATIQTDGAASKSSNNTTQSEVTQHLSLIHI